MNDPVMPGPDPEVEPEVIAIPERVKYGIFVYETTDEMAEPAIHVHAPNEYASISVGHLLRLLISAVKNLEAELIWQKFNHKAKAQQATSKIIKPGGPM